MPKDEIDEFDDDDVPAGDDRDPDEALLDSEIDFDDETDDDQMPLDYAEAREVGANLDDPRRFDDE